MAWFLDFSEFFTITYGPILVVVLASWFVGALIVGIINAIPSFN